MADEQNFSAETTARSKMILIAEDDLEVGRMLVQLILQETPYNAELVRSARDVLRVVQETIPDLFLFDYHLPSMTGIQLYDQLQDIKKLKAIPAIMMSASLPTDELEKRQIIGVKKPFNVDRLLTLIDQALE